MKKRAVLLVPGFSRRERFAARDQLVNALTHYTDGYKTAVLDDGSQDVSDAVTVTVASRNDHYECRLDIYEAFWGDLIPDWSEESPWQRFKRGLVLILYWATGGLARAVFIRRQLPSRTIVGLLFYAFVMMLWYLTVINVLALAFEAQEIDQVEWVRILIERFPDLGVVSRFFATLNEWSIYIFLVGILGLGVLEGVSNVSAFLRAYLRDDPLGEDDIGLRAKSRHRVIKMLDQVYAEENGYDEVHVVAHSLGGSIAIDALAECGKDLSRTTLHTWGAMLGLLSQQEELVEGEIAKIYASQTQLNNWIDVVFAADWIGSPRPVPRVFKDGKPTKQYHTQLFPKTMSPAMPKTPFNGYKVHGSYYRCETVMLALVGPDSHLPQRVDVVG